VGRKSGIGVRLLVRETVGEDGDGMWRIRICHFGASLRNALWLLRWVEDEIWNVAASLSGKRGR
jgi:hypothetical protein